MVNLAEIGVATSTQHQYTCSKALTPTLEECGVALSSTLLQIFRILYRRRNTALRSKIS